MYFHVTSTGDVAVLMRARPSRVACLLVEEKRSTTAAPCCRRPRGYARSGRKGTPRWQVLQTGCFELQRNARPRALRAAKRWTWYIARGASGKGAVGTKLTGECLIVDLAATRLPCGKPALELLDRFSNSEIEAIRDAMKAMGPDGWYWPVVAGPRDDDVPAP